ncbi:MAG TPA: HD domain-containing phosphohydrolase, partial [Candidatus Baltobacteraceae bacterium]
VLAFFGMVADYAAGGAAEDGERVASLATAMASLAGFAQDEIDALYFAARLRNIGALGNGSLAKAEPLPERELTMLSWDIPADGARMCERIAALPDATADIVRWQAECWDGTGYPDQLRWSGIPKTAQLLHIAGAYATAEDPEDALTAITMDSGRRFAPDCARTFIMWFHTTGGEIESIAPAGDALRVDRTPLLDVLQMFSAQVDLHNGTPGRAPRVARCAQEIATQLGCDGDALRDVTFASLLFGIGELRAAQLESSQFDPLARLGIERRAEHALAAANLLAQCRFLSRLAPVLRARAEWYDGTGAPDGLRHDAIPRGAQILAAALAYDAIDEAYRSRITEERTVPIARLETASGTQFDPHVIRALGEAVKARA